MNRTTSRLVSALIAAGIAAFGPHDAFAQSSSLKTRIAKGTLPTASAPSPATKPSGTASRRNARTVVRIRTREGDSLSLLADRFGVTAEEIAELNSLNAFAALEPRRELMIPLPSPADLLKSHPDSRAETSGIVGAENAWENVNGVWFRAGTTTRTNSAGSEANFKSADTSETRAATSGLIVNAVDAQRSTATQPVWIYLQGGAQVEADKVIESEEGAWYTRGNLSMYLERSRILRIERNQSLGNTSSSTPWKVDGWTTGNDKFDALIKENGTRYGIDPYLIFCVMEQESQFKPWVVSPKGARGLMQLMPGTAARFGVRRVFDPAENIMGGARYLKQLLENFDGKVDLVLAGYNAGEGAVMKYGGNVPPYRETRNYVKRIGKRYGQSRSVAAAPGIAGVSQPGLP